jgi:hypothetical protein
LKTLQKQGKLKVGEDRVVRLKIGGDGSELARTRNVTTILMSVLNLNMQDFRKDENVHTLMLMDGNEEYNRLAQNLKPLCEAMRSIQDSGIDIEAEHFIVEFWLAADYKFLCMVLGHEGARALFNCVFCLANRNEWKQTLQKVIHVFARSNTLSAELHVFQFGMLCSDPGSSAHRSCF